MNGDEVNISDTSQSVTEHAGLADPAAQRLLAAVRNEALEGTAYLGVVSRARFLWQIHFPLVLPGLVATSVFSFTSAWNAFLSTGVLHIRTATAGLGAGRSGKGLT